MSPGPAEQAGKVATGIVDAMRTQPILLFLMVMNIVVFAAVFWSIRQERQMQFEISKMSVDLLAKCVTPERGQ
jgi:hypothetical protein